MWLGLRVGLQARYLKACGRDPARLKRLNFVDKKLVKTINAFIMYKIVSFFHASIGDKKFCRINKFLSKKWSENWKFWLKMVKFQWKNHLKTVNFAQFSMKKKHYGIIQFARRGFFLKNDAGTRAALFKIFKLCNFALFAFRFNVHVTWFNKKFCGSQKNFNYN